VQRSKQPSVAGAASNAIVGTIAILARSTVETIGAAAAVFAFDVIFIVGQDPADVTLLYNASLYAEATMRDRLDMLKMVAEGVTSGGIDTTTIRSLPTITESMRERLLRDWQPERVPPKEYWRTLPDVFIESAEVRCNKYEQNAVLEPSTGRTITYHEMVVRARKLARFLHKSHPDVAWGEDATCGIHVPRCLDWYVMMLGIHLAGGAYLSLDPDFPADRLLYSLEDSGAVCLFTLKRMVGSLGFKGPTHAIDELWETVDAIDDSEPFTSPAKPTTPAYLIYTSGSTGKPKGVCIEHHNAVNFVESERRLFGLGNEHRVLQGFSTSFDASVEELWLAFATGSTLVVVEKAVMQDVELLGQLVEATKATIISTVPTLLATIEPKYLATIQMVIAGGEACNREVIAAYATGGKRRFVNSYGPTEATVACMADFSSPDRPVTIGRPQPGYFACIVNSRMELLPPGVPGELCMAGPSVARGYVKRPELTEEKFTHCPYVALPKPEFDYDEETARDAKYERLYHTGDLTRWNAEGRVEFLGRIDSQVKLRGFRIEVGEIETNLAAFPGVRTAIVHLVNDEGRQFLCGYLLCEEALENDFQEHRFRDFLKDKLPNYMVPSRFCVIKEVPRSPAGKLDRKQLKPPPPVVHAADEGGEKVAPATETEHMLHRLWSNLFPGQRIGTTDDFFEIGGQSLLAGKLASKIRHEGYPEFGIRLVYSNPTIMALANIVDAMEREEPTQEGAAAQQAPLRLPARGEPSALRKAAFLTYQAFIFIIAITMQWAYLLAFFFLFYGSYHQTIADVVNGRGFAFVVFFGFMMQLFFVVTTLFFAFMLIPLLKWLIIQKVKPGRHSIWSAYYLRWWTVRTFNSLTSGSFLYYGTYAYNVQLWLSGAKLGQGVRINCPVADADLLDIGDDTFIGDNAALVTSQVIDSVLVLATVKIGACCSVGPRTAVVGGSHIEDEATVGALSLIREGVTVPHGERWQGSPAQKIGYSPSLSALQSWEGDMTQLKNQNFSPTAASVNDFGGIDTEMLEGSSIRLPTAVRFIVGLLQIIYWAFLNLFTSNVLGILTFGAWCLCDELAERDQLWYACLYVIGAPFLTLVIMIWQHLMIIIARWVVFPWKVEPGMYACDGLTYHRKILFDMLARVSLLYAHPMYGTLFTQYYLRAMGVNVGRNVECSNLYGFTPGLTTLGNECFIADFVGVNPSDEFRGILRLDHMKVGDRAFVGNGSVLMPGTVIGERALVGLTSCPTAPVEPGKTAIGSPAFEIPRRTSADTVDQEKTFAPRTSLVVRRVIWEMFRCVMPATFITFSAVLAFIAGAAIFYGDSTAILRQKADDEYLTFIGLALLFVVSIAFFNVLFTLVTKWIIVGDHHAEENPLWSAGVWRSEFVVDVATVVGLGGVINFFRGTLYLPWLFRMLGARIGKNVFLDTLYLTEPDMVTLGDGACVNYNATLQTHLFEDRVMKMDTQEIGARCSVGSYSIVLYNTHVGDGSTIAPASLIMKGESLPRATHWAGIPAQKSKAPDVMRDPANIEVVARPLDTTPQSPARVANAVESNRDFERRARAASAITPQATPNNSFAGVNVGVGLTAASTWLAASD